MGHYFIIVGLGVQDFEHVIGNYGNREALVGMVDFGVKTVSRDVGGAGMMLSAVLLWSCVPLIFAKSGGVDSPFLFNAVWRVGVVLSGVFIFWGIFREIVLNPAVWLVVGRNLFRWTLPMAMLNSFQFALFSWSTWFVDISVGAVLMEMWPVVLVFLMSRLLTEQRGYRRNIGRVLPLLALGFLGVGFVVASQSGGFGFLEVSGAGLLKGVSLGLGAAILGGFDAFTFRWGEDLAEKLEPVGLVPSVYRRVDVTLFGSLIAYGLTSIPGLVVSAGIGVARGEVLSHGVLLVGLTGGLLIHGSGNLLFRKANLTTTNLGVNALGYLTPALSVVLLAVFFRVGVVRLDYLVVGVVVIIATNLLVNFRTMDPVNLTRHRSEV